MCGSLQVVFIRLEEQGAGRFGWSVWVGDQLVILSSCGAVRMWRTLGWGWTNGLPGRFPEEGEHCRQNSKAVRHRFVILTVGSTHSGVYRSAGQHVTARARKGPRSW